MHVFFHQKTGIWRVYGEMNKRNNGQNKGDGHGNRRSFIFGKCGGIGAEPPGFVKRDE